MAVMAEFLRRGYNVAVPEIDVGEDVFVVRDVDGDLSRVQVKAAIGKGRKTVAGTFRVSLTQLQSRRRPDLFYVLTLYHGGLWREFVIIPRKDLWTLHQAHGIGNVADGHLLLRLSFTDQDALCGGASLQPYRSNWPRWPPIRH